MTFSTIIKDFFNRNAADRADLKAIYEAARENGNALPLFSAGEGVLLSDGVEATLITREKHKDEYRYFREVYPVEKIKDIMETVADENAFSLSLLQRAFSGLPDENGLQMFFMDDQIDYILQQRDAIFKTIPVVERLTGLKIDDPITIIGHAAQYREGKIISNMPKKTFYNADIDAHSNLYAHFSDTPETCAESFGDNQTKKLAQITHLHLARTPHLSN